jgi:Protein involved in biosynthesis of mitomycin antibiotics/polyketide fumonisin
MIRYSQISKHVHGLKTEGYTIVPELLDSTLVSKLREEVLQIICEEAQQPHFELQQSQIYQSSQYLRHSYLDKLINSEELLHLASLLYEGKCLRYLQLTSVKAPGGSMLQYHQDNLKSKFTTAGINFWIALEDIDEENGCLCLVPGSHKLGSLEWVPKGDKNKSSTLTWNPDNAVPIRLRGGDCVVFDRLIIHGSLSNRTSTPRVAYAMTFHLEDVAFFEDGEWKPLKTALLHETKKDTA